jgi:hypothetical protein
LPWTCEIQFIFNNSSWYFPKPLVLRSLHKIRHFQDRESLYSLLLMRNWFAEF